MSTHSSDSGLGAPDIAETDHIAKRVRTALGARSVVMVGLMGAGKSCIGRLLARRLGLPFKDADTEIEAAAGCSIADIFSLYGEAAFRDGEARVIARLLDSGPMVLATGGGAFMHDATRALIAARAVAVWLRADLALLVKRTAGKTHRPLLNQGNPETILAGLMAERYPVYAQAAVTITCRDEAKEITRDAVLGHLDAWLQQEEMGARD